MTMTIFYDGTCPLCAKEMRELERYDKKGQLNIENIYAEDFQTRYPDIDIKEANAILHGLDHNGNLLLGLDATVGAWRTVGKHRWLSILRWPLISWFADKGYLFFARHRMRISRLFLGQQSCSELCEISPKEKSNNTPENCARNPMEDAEF